MKSLISIYLILVTASTFTLAFEWWNDLRVTWGRTSTQGYDHVPRNVRDAVLAGWILRSSECTNNGRFNGFRYTNPNDTGVALLFDVNGFVGGLQTLVPQRDLNVVGSTYRFDHVPMFQNHTIDGVAYFVVTVYFQTPSKLCSGSSNPGGNIGESSLVYFQNGPSPSNLKVAYKSRRDANLNRWNAAECVPGMGWHNFYAVETWETTNCNDYQPTCLLYNEYDELFGVCLLYPGNTTVSKRWEHPTSQALSAILGPEVPQCLLNQVDRVGFTTLHLYFSNTPWRTDCTKHKQDKHRGRLF